MGMTRSGFALVVLTLAGCTETLRVPPPTDDTAGAAGAAGSGYAIATPSSGGGLVSGSGAAATGPHLGPGRGRQRRPRTHRRHGRDERHGRERHAPHGTGTAGMALFPPPGAMPSPGWESGPQTQYIPALPAPPIGMSRDGTVLLLSNGLLWVGQGTNPAFLFETIPTPTALSSDGTTVYWQRVSPAVSGAPHALERAEAGSRSRARRLDLVHQRERKRRRRSHLGPGPLWRDGATVGAPLASRYRAAVLCRPIGDVSERRSPGCERRRDDDHRPRFNPQGARRLKPCSRYSTSDGLVGVRLSTVR